MAQFQAKTDLKQISIILNLIKIDCADLYKTFRGNKTQLKQAIEQYEEFVTDEINKTLFQNNTNFSDIVRNHRRNYSEFLDEFVKKSDAIANHQNATDDSYVFFISLQNWFIDGSKCGQQFYFTIDIDSFKYNKSNCSNGLAKVKTKTSSVHAVNVI